MIEHSPAPWEVSRDAVPKGHVQSTIYDAEGHRVATVFLSEENIRLITAAPELLAALSVMLGAAETELLDDKSNVWRSAMIDARAAIAKATQS